MTTAKTSSAAILIATDDVANAGVVKRHLEEEFKNVFVSTNPDLSAQDFEGRRPDVLLLAFDTLEKSERYYLGLYRLCAMVQQHPHRTVILCNKDEVKRVYELCKKHYFDDYVLFWPLTYDMSRLAMSVHHALRELASIGNGGPSASEFAAQARRLAELERLLDEKMALGHRHIDLASRAMEQAEQQVGSAFDKFSRRLMEGALPNAATAGNADALNAEISRIKQEEIRDHFRIAAEAAAPLKQWADDFGQQRAPHLASLRALNALAAKVQSTVLMVDDDELQRKLVAKILEAENYRLLFAGSGFEALGLLRGTRPDLILMDVMMPDMDGVEATRRLKAAPQTAGIPVIMITGKSEKNVVTESLRAGAKGFLVKPFERDTLIAKVRQALNGG